LAALLEAEVTERADRRERRRLIDARFALHRRRDGERRRDRPIALTACARARISGGSKRSPMRRSGFALRPDLPAAVPCWRRNRQVFG
jgi:hypothetical protein